MRDQTVRTVKQNDSDDLQVSCLMVRNAESLSEVEIKDIKQSKYPIIHGDPKAFVGIFYWLVRT